MPKILIVEDEYFLADDCEKEARRAGFDVAGPFATLNDVRTQIENGITFDAALIDVNLLGEAIYPLLDDLLRQPLPIVLYTGYDRAYLPERFRSLPLFPKPGGCSEAVAHLKCCL